MGGASLMSWTDTVTLVVAVRGGEPEEGREGKRKKEEGGRS